jgi:hypothetical protein
VAVDDAGNDIGEIAMRLDAGELAALDQPGNDGPMLGACIGAGEEGVFARQGNHAVMKPPASPRRSVTHSDWG